MDRKGLTKSDVARLVYGETTDARGYTVANGRQTVGAYLSGRMSPRMKTIIQYADALGVRPTELKPTGPITRTGSGIFFEAIDQKTTRLEVNVVAPKEVVEEVVRQLLPYAT